MSTAKPAKPKAKPKTRSRQDGDRADPSAAVVLSLASSLRTIRGSRGWSLEELARRSGVSRGMLLQIEGARTNASVATLARISDALGVPVTDLLEPPEGLGRVARASSVEPLPRGTSGSEARLLLSDGRVPFVELWEFRLEPHDEVQARAHPPGTRELLYVIDGTSLVVEVGGLVLEAGAGDAIALQADRPHTYRNGGNKRVRFSMAVVHGDSSQR